MRNAAFLAMMLASCGGNTPPPTPTPSPTPIPSPSPSDVVEPTILKVVGTRWHTHGHEVYLLGEGGECCGDPMVNGWPQISEPRLREIAAHGANFIHIRLGPNSPELEPRAWMRPYLADGSWNDEFFVRLDNLIGLAYTLGVYVEVDLVDAWVLKTPALSAWNATCDLLQSAPHGEQERWLRKVVREIGRNENILWQISNESGRCGSTGTTPAWELGVVQIVRDEEARTGALRHPIATNGEIRKVDMSPVIDYVETHQNEAPEQGAYNKPIMVNEYNPGIGPEGFRRQLEIAASRGTYFMYWKSDDTETERRKALDIILEYRRAHDHP